MKATFFKNIEELRDWLELNHGGCTELWLGYYKKKSKNFNFSWSDSVDELLCYGWIDGIRKSIDEERYMIRITPRKPKSNWSLVNLNKIKELKANNRLQEPGLKAFAHYNPKNANQYSFEQKTVKLSAEHLKIFKANKKAWAYYKTLSPSLKKQVNRWVISAKREQTRLRRLNELITCSENQKKIPSLDWKKKQS